MQTRLYRSASDQMISGVCGGLARYLRLDSTFVRLFFALLALGNGVGIIMYVILWMIMPKEDAVAEDFSAQMRASAGEMAHHAQEMGAEVGQVITHPTRETGMIIGIALIVVGSMFLIEALNLPGLGWISFDVLWPLLLVGAGILLLFRNVTET